MKRTVLTEPDRNFQVVWVWDSFNTLDTNRLHYGDITLKASFHHTPATCRTAFDLITTGRFHSAAYITGRAALDEVPALFHRMVHRGTPTPRSSANAAGQGTPLALAAAADLDRLDIKTAVFPAGADL